MTRPALALDTHHTGGRPLPRATRPGDAPRLRLVGGSSTTRRLQPAELRHLLDALDLRRRRAQIRARHALA